MALDVGTLLDNKYEIRQRLATGGMGDVYLVQHRHLQELRVIKVLRTDLASDDAVMGRFQQEARVATQIKHANVAILYDYSQLTDGRFYMVWEYIEGEDLGTTIRDRGPLGPELAIDLAIQALRGLDAIHSAGVIHRDVSPDNLMVTRDRRGNNRIKIIDLGLAKNLTPGKDMELTQAGTFLGKFQYCSPEQAGEEDQPLDHRSDLYSLAQVLYELLTGLPPFESQSQHGFIFKRLTEDPLPLRERRPELDLPPGLEAVVMKGLARDRDGRYPDAGSFIKALGRQLDELRGVATRDLTGESVAQAKAVATRRAALPPKRAKPEPDETGAITRAERQALLAKIDRAASRVQETSKIFSRAELALKEGRFEDAAIQIQKLEMSHPRLKGLAQLKTRLEEAEGIAKRRQQVLQAEQMLEKYLLERQQTLARLALEALIELYPNHPKRTDYESWVELIADEAQQQKRAEEAFAKGREAMTAGDLEQARKHLAEVESVDLSGKLAGTLMSELHEWEKGREDQARVDTVRRRFEEHLDGGKFEDARKDLEALSRLDVPRVTLDTCRAQLEEARARKAQDQEASVFEARYKQAVSQHDWFAARDVVTDLEAALPNSPRPQQMYSEIARLQVLEQKERSLVEGLAAFDRFLAAGDVSQADLAHRVLRQLAADDPQVIAAGERLAAAKG